MELARDARAAMGASKTLPDLREKASKPENLVENPKARKASSTGNREHLARGPARIGQRPQSSPSRPAIPSACLLVGPACRTEASPPDDPTRNRPFLIENLRLSAFA